jgi:selenocysteine lyase/cysteine desulfurase
MIPCQRELFDIPDGINYLNCAYMSPLLRSAVEAGMAGVARKARPWEITQDDFFSQSEELRSAAARLFQCSASDIAIVPSASFGVSTAALNLTVERGQKVLLLDEQFPSNVYPWRRLVEKSGSQIVTVRWPDDHDWTSAVLREIDDRVAIAALPHTHWTSGGLLDLEKIGDACRRHGTALVLDLTQSLGAYPIDVQRVQPDFAVAAAYKWLLSPYSTGVMYVSPKRQRGLPLEENWILRDNSLDFSSLIVYSDGYHAGARRFDMGERSNFGLIPAVICALGQILTWSVDEISQAIGRLTRKLIDDTRQLGLVAPPDCLRAPHYLCLRSSVPLPKNLTNELAAEGIYISVRGASLRITPHVYNSEKDVEQLVGMLQKTLSKTT